MVVRVVVPERAERWHDVVVSALENARGVEVEVEVVPADEPRRPQTGLLSLYARLDGWAGGGPPPRPRPGGERAPAAVVDLVGGAAPGGAPVIAPHPPRLDARALLGGLARGERTLRLEARVATGGGTRVAAAGRIAVARLSARRTADRAAPRMAALVVRALAQLDGGEPVTDGGPAPADPSSARVALLLARAAAASVRASTTVVEWRVARGRASSPWPFEVPGSRVPVPAPAGHWYADPFVARTEAGTFVFVEDFDEALGRASLAVVGPDGGPALPILSAPYHLSYPLVFAHDGTWFMTPESGAAREIVLHRCDAFPATWSRDTVLLDGVEAYDPTLLQHDGRWWLFFASGTPGAADDELNVWFADDLRGPYEPHPRNPVVSDVVGARPAGRVVAADGRLLRPGQDGSREYGGAIVVHEIDELTTSAYREHPVARIDGRSVGAAGTHTLDRAGDVVVVDTKHRVLRRPARRARP